MLGIIKKIEEICNVQLGNVGKLNGSNGSRLGFSGMINAIYGCGGYDGYIIETDQHTFHILIDNGQSCCESWGHFASEDDFEKFIGKELKEVKLTDTALNSEKVENSDYYDGDEGGIQFVNFIMNDGSLLQFAVYNYHNGYYGHAIIFAKDEEILLSDTL